VIFTAIEDGLNEQLTLADYEEAVKSMYGTFLATQANNKFHDEFIEYKHQQFPL